MAEPIYCEPCQVEEGIDVPATQEAHECWPLCDNHRTAAAEKAWENFCSDYYGGDGPVTMQEHYDAAAKLDRSQR